MAYGAIAAVLIVGAAFGIVTWNRAAADTGQPATKAANAQSTAIVKTDLSTGRTIDGALGFGAARPVKGSRDGVVTWLPAPGTTVKRGEQLYRVNDAPVALFYGAIPLFRTLDTRNMVGRDVRVVHDNLKALGYQVGSQPKVGTTVTQAPPPPPAPPAPPADAKAPGGGSAPAPSPSTTKNVVRDGDGVLTEALGNAVKKWQKDRGQPATGAVVLGDVVVLDGAVRVDAVTVQTGDAATGPLMSLTPTTKVITVSAPVAEAGTINQGDPVTVTLPDGKPAPGKVSAVGTVATQNEGQAGDNAPKLSVTVTLDDAGAVENLDAAQVKVEFVAETHQGVLAVPVGALLALSEGGYAVQVAGGGLVAVKTGIFAKGMVEISGAGLAEGTRVVTTS
jgi:hypothetical protein